MSSPSSIPSFSRSKRCTVVATGSFAVQNGSSRVKLNFFGFNRLSSVRVLQVAVGTAHALLLCSENNAESGNAIYTVGANTDGQLGLGDNTKLVLEEPKRLLIPLAEREGMRAVRCSGSASAVITNRNRLFTWGTLLARRPIFTPEHVPLEDQPVIDVVFGPLVTVVLTHDPRLGNNVVWSWGECSVGSLGHRYPADVSEGSSHRMSVEQPRMIAGLRRLDIVQVAFGERHFAALTSLGRVYLWGNNERGRLGVLPHQAVVSVPTLLDTNLRFKAVACVDGGVLALSRDGVLWVWGKNSSGSLGLPVGEPPVYARPRPLNMPQITEITACIATTLVKTVDGDTRVWGLSAPLDGDDAFLRPVSLALVIPNEMQDASLVQAAWNASFALFMVEPLVATFTFRQQQTTGAGPEQASIALSLSTYETPRALLSSPPPEWPHLNPRDHLVIDGFGCPLDPQLPFRYRIETVGTSSFFIAPIGVTVADVLIDCLSFDAATGVVRSGPVSALLGWLVNPYDTNESFLQAFLLSYRLYNVSSLQLLSFLINCFNRPPPFASQLLRKHVDMKNYRAVPFRVCAVLQYWISFSPRSFLFPDRNSAGIISELNTFIQTADFPSPHLQTQLRRAVLKYLDPFDDRSDLQYAQPPAALASNIKLSNDEVPSPDPPLPGVAADELFIFRYSVRELARQITLIDFRFFSRVDPCEFSMSGWTKRDKVARAPNILRSILRHTNFTEWVVATILTAVSHRERVRIVELFIELANELKHMGNFTSFHAIMHAFASEPIYRLDSIWNAEQYQQRLRTRGGEAVPAAVRPAKLELLRMLKEIAFSTSSREILRADFQNRPFPKIPFIGAHLSDLVRVDEGNRSFIDEDEKSFTCNFSKALLHRKVLLPLLECQWVPYLFEPVAELQECLRNVRGFPEHEQTAASLSKVIESDGPNGLPRTEADLPSSGADPLLPVVFEVDDYEIQQLNSAAELVLLDHANFDRCKLWRSWLQRDGKDWQRLFVQSNVIEMTVRSIVTHPLSDVTEFKLAKSLFSTLLGLSEDECMRLVTFLGTVGKAHLGERERTLVSTMISSYKWQQVLSFDDAELQRNEESVSRLRAAFDEGQEDVDGLAKTLSGLLEYFMKAIANVSTVKSALGASSQQGNQSELLLEHLKNITPLAQTHMEQLQESFAQAKSDLDRQTAEQTRLDGELAELQQQEDALVKQLAAVRARIASVKEERSTFDGSHSRTGQTINDLQEEISQHASFMASNIDFGPAIKYIENDHNQFAKARTRQLANVQTETNKLSVGYTAAYDLFLDLAIAACEKMTLELQACAKDSAKHAALKQGMRTTLQEYSHRIQQFLPDALLTPGAGVTSDLIAKDIFESIPPKVDRFQSLMNALESA